jgi:hypothetical protein
VADAPAARSRWWRRFVVAAAIFLLVAVVVRVCLTIYAADLFVAVLARALAGTGAEVVFQEPPSVSSEGFESKGVVLRSVSGQEWVQASEATGSAHLSFRQPYVSVSLTLKSIRASLAASRERDPRDRKSSQNSLLDLSLPASISGIELEDARIDLGGEKIVSFDAAIERAGSGSTLIKIDRLDYTEPSGESAGEKIAGTITAAAASGTGRRLDLNIESGAVLLGTVLFDFDKHPLSFVATVAEAAESMTFGDATLSFGKLVRGSGSFALAGGALASADVRLASDDIEPAWATLVREPFAGVTPALTGSELDGRGEVRLELRSPSRHQANATVTLSLQSLRTRSVEANGLTVELPWIGARQGKQLRRPGKIRAKSVGLLGLSWSGIDVPLEATAGRIRASSVQEWRSAGGTMRVSALAFDDDGKAGPRVSGDVELSGFDLAALGEVLGWERLAGSLRGNLGRVVIDGDAVRATGTAEIAAWGGAIHVSGLAIENPFGRVPELGLDAVVRDLDLESLTTAFGFGRISGVLEGRVTGLVIADAQPQAFEADLHTVDKRGVSQTIDVRAISQLGALGGDTGSLTGSLLRVVKRYRYSAMGIRCRLRNDVFEIRGVETKGGRDYLVKGSLLPPSVSVVSHSQVISFSEMLRRVERITAINEGESPDAASQP